MGFFTSLFSSSEITKKAVDLVDDSVRGVGNWIDEQQFTDQEKAENVMKLMEFRLKVLERTSSESSVRSISRRLIAWGITSVFLLLLIMAGVVYKFDRELAGFLLDEAHLLNPAFWTVVGFYFASHIGANLISEAKK